MSTTLVTPCEARVDLTTLTDAELLEEYGAYTGEFAEMVTPGRERSERYGKREDSYAKNIKFQLWVRCYDPAYRAALAHPAIFTEQDAEIAAEAAMDYILNFKNMDSLWASCKGGWSLAGIAAHLATERPVLEQVHEGTILKEQGARSDLDKSDAAKTEENARANRRIYATDPHEYGFDAARTVSADGLSYDMTAIEDAIDQERFGALTENEAAVEWFIETVSTWNRATAAYAEKAAHRGVLLLGLGILAPGYSERARLWFESVVMTANNVTDQEARRMAAEAQADKLLLPGTAATDWFVSEVTAFVNPTRDEALAWLHTTGLTNEVEEYIDMVAELGSHEEAGRLAEQRRFPLKDIVAMTGDSLATVKRRIKKARDAVYSDCTLTGTLRSGSVGTRRAEVNEKTLAFALTTSLEAHAAQAGQTPTKALLDAVPDSFFANYIAEYMADGTVAADIDPALIAEMRAASKAVAA